MSSKQKKEAEYIPAQTITDADYADDIALLANTTTQAETQLPRLDRATTGIDLHVKADKTEYICFFYTLKTVDNFTSRRISVSLTEKDINTRLAKA